MLTALGQGEYNLIVTAGVERDLAAFGPQPPTVHLARYVPQAAILPRCDVVVSHGGSGTLLGALAHGLPLLIVPLGGDHFPSAERLLACKVAEVLTTPEVNVQPVRTRVSHVWRRSVRRLPAERDPVRST